VLEVHKELTVRGDPVRFDAFIRDLATRAAPGWSRDQEREQELSSLSPRRWAYVFKSSAQSDRVAVSLFLTTGRAELTVTNIVPQQPGSLTRAQYNAILDEFARLYVVPIAPRFGLEVDVTPDHLPITHWLSGEAARRLTLFSRAANKGTGSGHPSDFERWVAFLIQTHREAAPLDAPTLSRWLVEEEGWPEETASDLAVEFEFGRSLLNAYDAAR
jgi:hypothetical protein